MSNVFSTIVAQLIHVCWRGHDVIFTGSAPVHHLSILVSDLVVPITVEITFADFSLLF